MKSADSKQTLDDIADFIRTEYSQDGVEIGAQGARSITVKLPEELALTELCADLWNEFNAPVELKSGTIPGEPILTVWAPEDPATHSAGSLSSSARQTSQHFNPCFGGCTLAQALAWVALQSVTLLAAFVLKLAVWDNADAAAWWRQLFNDTRA